MINQMQQVVVAGRQRDSRAIMQALQTAGVLHIVPVDTSSHASAGAFQTGPLGGAAADERRETERLLARTESSLAQIGVPKDTTRSALLPEDQWAALVESVATPAAALEDREAALRSDLDARRTYGDVVSVLSKLASRLDERPRFAVLSLTTEKPEELQAADAALRAELKDRYALSSAPVRDGLNAVVVAVLAADRERARSALSKARLGELRLPGRFERLPLASVAQEFDRIGSGSDAALNDVQAQKKRLADQHGPALLSVRDALADRVAIDDARAQTARGKYGFVLQGYVPVDRVDGMKAALSPFGNSVLTELSAVDEHHNAGAIPVQLKNNDYTRNFEFMLNISDPPRYGTFDPSWVVAFFFPIFFGFIVADIGFGALFLGVAIYMLGKSRRGESMPVNLLGLTLDPATLYQVGYVLRTMSLWSILFGALTGEFFGNILEKLHVFYVDPGIIKSLWGVTLTGEEHATGIFPILLPRVLPEFSNTLMVICLLIGIVFVLWSWALRLQLSFKHKHMHHFWEALGMLGGLVGLICLAFVSRAGRDFGALGNFSDWRVDLMIVGFVVFVVGLIMSRAVLMLIEILSQGGSIISFTRLFAVGVAAAILANLATDLGWSLGGTLPVIGPILGILVGLLVHTFLFVLTILGHVMQPIRLMWVEYLNPTGFYQENGIRYNPFARVSLRK
ncbi:V-type ATPase 116kDa subunit family protein [Deinococcus aquiradiocola]|uniref:V-type ATP synthase subunit I n=1 Tax=Deinococcus aquiradiocola TaxID=393059 RepID=A0A917PJC0_9DEIO|nr:V-type ATPase 116kDa subunit family protein [Deinococcus aquiradiocola]GGJ81147.1 v-type ATP synthase subunit I [Deinococcus aquiradiocola]